jgi:hypothetical protein
MSLWQSVFQCCAPDDSLKTYEMKLTEVPLFKAKYATQRQGTMSVLTTEVTTQLYEHSSEAAVSERNQFYLHETVMHMCSDTATSFGDSLLSFKTAMRQQTHLRPV